MFDYLTIKDKVKPESLSTLKNEECFEKFSEWEAENLIKYCKSDIQQNQNKEELENLFSLLSEASKKESFSYKDVRESSLISKSNLSIKAKYLETYLDSQDPEWRNKMKYFFSNNVLCIIKMIVCCDKLDCSIFYILDGIIDAETALQYNAYLNYSFRYAASPGEHFYDRFYKLKWKENDSNFNNAFKKFRSYSDFKRAKMPTRFGNWIEAGFDPLMTHRIHVLYLQSLALNIIYRISSIVLCDYHVYNYFHCYLAVLNRLIPDRDSFEKAELNGFFDKTDIDWKGFFLLTDGVTRGEVKFYHDEVYQFLTQANVYFYDYSGAFIRDLHDKMVFEPVTFYFAVITFIFFPCYL